MIGVGYIARTRLIQKDYFIVIGVIIHRLVTTIDGQQWQGIFDDIVIRFRV